MEFLRARMFDVSVVLRVTLSKKVKCVCCGVGAALQSLSETFSELGSRALSTPAGVLGTIAGTVSTLPSLLVGDFVAAYGLAANALAQLESTGAPSLPQNVFCRLSTFRHQV